MLVFGDHVAREDPRGWLATLRGQIEGLANVRAGIERHTAIVDAFLVASELAQGLGDAAAIEAGVDARDRVADLAMDLAVALATAVDSSWTSGLQTTAPAMPACLDTLEGEKLPSAIQIKRAEGYAYYALYPESYATAASHARRQRRGPRYVIGIRSIGAGLAAMIAAAMHAPRPSSVRPVGPPYQRQLAVAPALVDEWSDAGATIAIVDEGPGMSGSSFGAVLDQLEARGLTDVECFPSHANALGPAASAAHRERWSRVPRHVVDVDSLLIDASRPEHRLAAWIEDLVGPLVAPLRDLSAGAWRELKSDEELAPVCEQQERRKFLARSEHGTWLAKFVGLGRAGSHAHDRERELAAAGFSPAAIGLRHGFSVSAWEDARCLQPARCDRPRLVDRVGRYLAFRAGAFRVARAGGSFAELYTMATINANSAIGDDASSLERHARNLHDLERAVRPIEIDGRMHAWEWLVRSDGTLVKTDAVDHHASHDLVGCQDITWDIAGAQIELGLDSSELARVVRIITESGHPAEPALLAFMRPCYIAFQIGRHAHAMAVASDRESARLRAIVERYTAQLRSAL